MLDKVPQILRQYIDMVWNSFDDGVETLSYISPAELLGQLLGSPELDMQEYKNIIKP